MRSLVDQTVARFGRLDAAVNSAGTEGKPGPVTEQTADSYAATFDTNVLGTLLRACESFDFGSKLYHIWRVNSVRPLHIVARVP